MAMLISRRGLLRCSLTAVAAGTVVAGVASRASAADKVCADPAALDASQQSLRTGMNYTEKAPDPSKTCSGCAFFQDGGDGCGTCSIFQGPANPKGHCDSWGAK